MDGFRGRDIPNSNMESMDEESSDSESDRQKKGSGPKKRNRDKSPSRGNGSRGRGKGSRGRGNGSRGRGKKTNRRSRDESSSSSTSTSEDETPTPTPTIWVPLELTSQSDMVFLGETKYYTKKECIFCMRKIGIHYSDNTHVPYPPIGDSSINRLKELYIEGLMDDLAESSCQNISIFYNDLVIPTINVKYCPPTLKPITKSKEVVVVEDEELTLNLEKNMKPQTYAPLPRITPKLVYDHYYDHTNPEDTDAIRTLKEINLIIKQLLKKGGIFKVPLGNPNSTQALFNPSISRELKGYYQQKSFLRKEIREFFSQNKK